MAKDQRNLLAFLGSDADFRSWGSGIAAQIAAVGLVQTADTGQINWATVARPAINTSAGYEIWRFADSLQATKPVFIRIEYGVAALVDRPRLIVRVGTATDGAGTLTGQVGTAVTLQTSGASKTAGVVLPSLCSGSTSRLNLLTNADLSSSNFAFLFFVERTKTNLGVDTGDGIACFTVSVSSSVNFQAIPFSGTVPVLATANPAISLAGAGISSVGPNVALSPTIICLGKAYFASWVAYISADLPKLTPVSVDHLGAVRTMLPISDTLVTGLNFVQGGISGHAIAMLWE